MRKCKINIPCTYLLIYVEKLQIESKKLCDEANTYLEDNDELSEIEFTTILEKFDKGESFRDSRSV